MYILATLALAAPTPDLCNQAALDARAVEENARWSAVGLLEMFRTTHQLTDLSELVSDGVTLRKGDRVVTVGSAGTVKPEESGHATEVRIAQQRGTVVCFTRTTMGDIRNELAIVRWDAQSWSVDEPPRSTVKLGVFASTIHPSYLSVVAPGGK